MRTRFLRTVGCALAALVFSALPAVGQTGTVVGTVTSAQDGGPVSNAGIIVAGSGQSALSGTDGSFRLQLPVGTYTLRVDVIGFVNIQIEDVVVRAGETTTVPISLDLEALSLPGFDITVRGGETEDAISGTQQVIVIGPEKIEARVTTTPIDHVKSLPGVDVAQNGLTASNVVSRGFNNVFSGALLVLTDGRYAAVPSLRFNAYNMIPANQFDIERMEVRLGPAAALYGPNSASGVLNIVTSSPIDEPGTRVSVGGGGQDVLMGQFRTAFRFSENTGFKISGQYLQGTEWSCEETADDSGLSTCDPAEYEARADDPSLPDRNYDTERYGFEARFDWRPDDDTQLILNAGLNNLVSSIEMTGIGTGQADDWIYSYYQARFEKGRFFAQAFMNQSSGGGAQLFQTGRQVEDESFVLATQVQQGFSLGERQDFIAGIDFQQTTPRTSGTIFGRNEDDDDITEVGGFLHSATELTDQLTLVGALRVDDHSRLEDLVFSPRAGLVFSPSEDRSFRVTYNRAFSTPTVLNLFLDIVAGSQGPYDVRALGVPESGFTFNSTCQASPSNPLELCMYSPFQPTGQIAADGLPVWNNVVPAVLTLAGLPEAQVAALSALLANPTAQEIQSYVGRLDLSAENPSVEVLQARPEGIGQIDPTIYNTFEVGYKGFIGSRLLVSMGVYTQQIKDFVGPLRNETPNVFYAPAAVQAFVTQRLGSAGLIGTAPGQLTPEQVGAIVSGLATLPVGTVAPDQLQATDLIVTYKNFGDVNLWGADLAAELVLNRQLSLNGSYSYVSDECFEIDGSSGLPEEELCQRPNDVALNAPGNKGSVGFRWDDRGGSGLTLDGRARFTEGFPMSSGVFQGYVDAYTVVDANVSYNLPWAPGATVGLTVTNLFDDFHREFVGAPFMGRMILGRVSYSF